MAIKKIEMAVEFFYERHGKSRMTEHEIAEGIGVVCGDDCVYRNEECNKDRCPYIIYFCRCKDEGDPCPLYNSCKFWDMPKVDAFTSMILSDMGKVESSGYTKWPGCLDDQPNKWLMGLGIAFSVRNKIDKKAMMPKGNNG